MAVDFGVRLQSPEAARSPEAEASGPPGEPTVRWEHLPLDVPRPRVQRGAITQRWRTRAPRPELGRVGRYSVLAQIAGGGMSSVYVALLEGPAQFSRLVAIKCLHTRWHEDPDYVSRFKNEIALSARVLHPNVVQTLDVVEEGGELFLVMEYVDGVTLAALMTDLGRSKRAVPVEVVCGIIGPALHGLRAAHEATDEAGCPLDIVHRDVSPQNIMLSRSGHVQLIDFGVAKAAQRAQHTAPGAVLGRLAYMAPERVGGGRSSARADVFGAGVVLWEMLAGKRLFYKPGATEGEVLRAVLLDPIPKLSEVVPSIPKPVEAVVSQALERSPERRFQSAREFAQALERATPWATPCAIAALVEDVCALRLAEKDSIVRRARATHDSAPPAEPNADAACANPESVQTSLATDIAALAVPRVRPRLLWLGGLGTLAAAGGVAAALLFGRAAPRAKTSAPLATDIAALHAQRSSAGQAAPASLARAPGAAALAAASAAPPPAVPPAPAAAIPEASAGGEHRGTSSGARSGAGGIESGRDEPRADARSGSEQGARAEPRPERRRSSRAARGARMKPSTLANHCDPPTYMGDDGIRHFKPSCL